MLDGRVGVMCPAQFEVAFTFGAISRGGNVVLLHLSVCLILLVRGIRFLEADLA